MNLHEITMSKAAAQEALEEYRASVHEALQYEEFELLSRVEKRRAEMEAADKQIVEGYRALANGRQVISLRQSLAAGGQDALFRPRLAVARADEPRIEMTRWTSGRVRYDPTTRRSAAGWTIEAYPRSGATSRRWDLLGLLPPEDKFKNWISFEAMAPHIPPHLRPKTLDRYAVLWEANWEKQAPVDPALLRPVGGDLYVVVATWDLTELERAVLNSSL